MIALTVKIKWSLFVGDYNYWNYITLWMYDSISSLNYKFNSLPLFRAVLYNESRVLKPPQIHFYRKMLFSHRHGSNCRINFKLVLHMAPLTKSVRIAYKDQRQYAFYFLECNWVNYPRGTNYLLHQKGFFFLAYFRSAPSRL